MSVGDWLVIAYVVVGLFFAVMTWVENQRVYYVSGPPSGCLSGLFWPLALVVALLSWWLDPMRKDRP